MQSILQEIANNKKIFKPVIYGIKGTELSNEEKSFFSKNSAIGFILFARNIIDKTQLKKLTASLRELMDGEVLILIDQEGGRVARLRPPHFNSYPAGKFFSDLYLQNSDLACQKLYENYQNIATELVEVGINVNCAPVLDVLTPLTHEVIGDRAFGDNPKQVAKLGLEVCNALLSKNVFPVIKHIPGHGKGACDSHLDLPVVNDDFSNLSSFDFAPFKELNQQKFAMTAHILYSAIDAINCGTISSKVIELIRHEIGFTNILMTDDLSMKALKNSLSYNTKNALKAGCDLILHCNGEMSEMLEINANLPEISDNFWQKFVK
ncbi:MAG: beta-N-acetylhexosaminidase [Alphaproteobacteria bacterium]